MTHFGQFAHNGVVVLVQLARAEEHEAENLGNIRRAAVGTVDLRNRGRGKPYLVDRFVERIHSRLENRQEKGGDCQHQRVQLLALFENEVAQRRRSRGQLHVTTHSNQLPC